jgi:hypothetical protein
MFGCFQQQLGGEKVPIIPELLPVIKEEIHFVWGETNFLQNSERHGISSKVEPVRR